MRCFSDNFCLNSQRYDFEMPRNLTAFFIDFREIDNFLPYDDGDSSGFSKWPMDRNVAVVKHCWPVVQKRKYWHAIKVSHEMIITALFACLCLKDKLGLCSIYCHIHAMTGNCSASLRVLIRCKWFLK